jgi:hypothetical protein
MVVAALSALAHKFSHVLILRLLYGSFRFKFCAVGSDSGAVCLEGICYAPH